jgi:hypothetical protein
MLGLIKNFVKGMDKTGHGFEYVRSKLPNVSDQGVCICGNPNQGMDARKNNSVKT